MLSFPLVLAALSYLCIFAFTHLVRDPDFYVNPITQANMYAMYIIPGTVILAAIWITFSYFGGGHMLLSAANAHEIRKQDNPEVYRLVENVCITMGMPLPKVYIIDDHSMNAFATGRDPQHASIALTSGIIARLDRPELEAVIAHEMGHVINRDITLMLITVAGISFFAFTGSILLRAAARSGRSRDKNDGAAVLLLFGIAVVFMIFAYFIAPLIRMAVSRSREYLADATSAHVTRNPLALASALRKISTDSRVESLDEMTAMAPMCIENPLDKIGSSFSGLTATHPPVAKRIAALEAMGR